MSAGPIDTKPLEIRGSPKPVRQFSKKALAFMLGGASLLVLASVGIAMSPSKTDRQTAPRELYSTSNKPTADGLSALPARYSDVSIQRQVPDLGPPLPGDLGAPILRAQREGRLAQGGDVAPAAGPIVTRAGPPMPPEQALMTARTIAAKESAIFFAVSKGGSPLTERDTGFVRSAPDQYDPFTMLNAVSAMGAGSPLGQDQNQQARKEAFLEAEQAQSIYNPHRLERPVSPYQIMAGTIISATLITGLNSDLPGQVIAQVTEPVFDTVTGEHLLIPQGSRVIGRYDSVIAYGQSRALIVWKRIIMPDGSSIQIENLPAADLKGYAGLSDRVDNHTLRLFSAAALSSLISVGVELSEDDDEQVARALREATQEGTSRAGDEIVRRQLSVQPTLTVRPGWRLRIMVERDLVLAPMKPF